MKRFLESLLLQTVKRPVITIVLIFGVTVFFTCFIPKLEIETDITEALPEWAPAKKAYDRLGEVFPSRDFLTVVIESPQNIFEKNFLKALSKITSEIEEINGVYMVISPTNMKIVREKNNSLIVKTAMEFAEPDKKGWEKRLKEIIESEELFREHLISENHKFAGIMVFLEKTKRPERIVKKIIKTVKKFTHKKYKVYFSGRPVTNYHLGEGMAKDMGTLMPLAFLLMLLILYITFRSIRGVLLPIGVVSIANLWTFGTMAMLGVSHSHSTNIMPILIFSIGIADSIHFLTRYYSLSENESSPRFLSEKVLLDLYPALIFTSLTTVAGFMALTTAHVHSLTKLAIFTSAGVMYALLLTLTLLPSFLAILPVKKIRKKETRFQNFFESYYNFITQNRKMTVSFTLLVIAIMIFGFTHLKVRFHSIENFKKGSEIRKAYKIVNSQLGGSTTLSIMIEKEKNAFLKPENIKKVKECEEFIKTLPHVKNAVSVADLIEKMNYIMHGENPKYKRIVHQTEKVYDPELQKYITIAGEKLIAQYLGMYELSGAGEQLNNMINYSFSAVHILAFLDTEERNILLNVRKKLIKKLDEIFPGSYLIDGMSEVVITVNDLIVVGQKRSLITSLLTVSSFSAIEFLSITYGLLSIIPLFFALLFNFGIMGLVGIPVNLMTMVTANIAIGVGVDYAIHFLHRYRREKDSKKTLVITGPPITFNAITTGLGFSILMFSQFSSVATMGFLIALAMFTASAGALLIFPLLLKGEVKT